MSILALVGRFTGAVLAPLAAAGSALRGARLFHPEGVLHRADVEPLGDGALARALAGPAWVRLSGALFRSRALPDILGAAVRFHPGTPREQDLLFATFRSVLALPFALFTTDARNYLANTYSTVLPSRVPGQGRVVFRLVPERIAGGPGDRDARLLRAVHEGRASFVLEVHGLAGRPGWEPLARLAIRERIEGGGEELRFNPWHAGLGIEPAGFFQTWRAVVYPASQLGRALARRA
jgi:hypothetical protein